MEACFSHKSEFRLFLAILNLRVTILSFLLIFPQNSEFTSCSSVFVGIKNKTCFNLTRACVDANIVLSCTGVDANIVLFIGIVLDIYSGGQNF